LVSNNFSIKACLSGILLIFVLLAGCSKKPESTGPEAGPRLFGVTYQTMNNPFFVDLDEGIRQVVEAHGDRLITLDAQWNSLKQRNDISDLITQNAAGIFINPVNWEGIKGSLLQAKRKNIPCIVVDAPVQDASLVLTRTRPALTE
jgi:ribose transport system substrate-binding protein